MSKETVTSKDGTTIAYWRSGHGPPLVLVHGTTADHSRWAPVLQEFEKHFSVCAVDRRRSVGLPGLRIQTEPLRSTCGSCVCP